MRVARVAERQALGNGRVDLSFTEQLNQNAGQPIFIGTLRFVAIGVIPDSIANLPGEKLIKVGRCGRGLIGSDSIIRTLSKAIRTRS